MIPRADIVTAVQPLAAAEAPTSIVSIADAKQEAFTRLAQIAIGQQMQAKVLSTYNDGSYLVRIANTAARMVLPTATRTGDSMQLTLISKDPRPTFLLTETNSEEEEHTSVSLSDAGKAMEKDLQALKSARQGTSGAVGRDTRILDADEQLPERVQTPAPESTRTSLSSAGKLVDALLHAFEESDLPAAIRSTSPLVKSPSDTPRLATALQESVTYSGTFYESHVAAWSEGKLPLAALQKEPQAQLHQQIQSSQSGSANLLENKDPANTQLGQLVNMQLSTLEQQRIVWHGQVWPGQTMEWEINRDASGSSDQDHARDLEDNASWHSVVRFNFARLGTVSASIRLTGDQIHMLVRADNDGAATALRANGNLLTQAMEAAGSSLDSLIVTRHEQS